MEPSGGHDYVDELIGLLRVAHMQRDDAESRALNAEKKLKEAREAYLNLRDFANSKGLDTAACLS